MRLHYFKHVPFEGLGSIANWAFSRRHKISATRLYAGETPPSLENIDFLVIMGGPMGVHNDKEHPWLEAEKKFLQKAVTADIPVLGICLGAQLIANALGAKVYQNEHKEIGWFPITKVDSQNDFHTINDFPSTAEAFHWHGDTFDIPTGAVHLWQSEACTNQGFLYQDRVLALQFHLETTAESATELIENSGHELVSAQYIQNAEQMLGNAKRFEQANKLMESILDRLTKGP